MNRELERIGKEALLPNLRFLLYGTKENKDSKGGPIE
jgi:hypothetical protein